MAERKNRQENELEGYEQVIQLFGEEHVRQGIERAKRMGLEFGELFLNFVYKGLYARKVLDIKVRQLCAISALTAAGLPSHLRNHILGAIRVGVTKDEVKEAIFQATTYGGTARMSDAFMVYEEAIKEVESGTVPRV